MFQPGTSGNPHGRPRGSGNGRAQALATLDRMLAKAGSQRKLEQALEAELDAHPVEFFRTLVVPLMPRNAREAPPPDANADWLPLDRTPPQQPPMTTDQ
jgi:hypothetical protein